jgi:hypothetical protein
VNKLASKIQYEDEHVLVFRDFFPTEQLFSLVRYLDSSETRKSRFSLGSGLANIAPECIVDAQAFAERNLNYGYDTALVKWYRSSDVEESGAYQVHRDPPEDQGAPLFLATVKGEALLTYISEEGVEFNMPSRTNNVIIVKDPNLRHKVSPPLGLSGERYFLFLGRSVPIEG